MMDKLTDFELNKAVAEALGAKIPKASVIKSSPFLDIKDNVIISFSDDGSRYDELFPDYCNNWNDLMPLVVEYLTAFWRAVDDPRAGDDAGKWTAAWGSVLSPKVDWNDNPQRALALCLLKVLEAKDD